MLYSPIKRKLTIHQFRMSVTWSLEKDTGKLVIEFPQRLRTRRAPMLPASAGREWMWLRAAVRTQRALQEPNSLGSDVRALSSTCRNCRFLRSPTEEGSSQSSFWEAFNSTRHSMMPKSSGRCSNWLSSTCRVHTFVHWHSASGKS